MRQAEVVDAEEDRELALITTDIIYLKNCSGEKIGGINTVPSGATGARKERGTTPQGRSNPIIEDKEQRSFAERDARMMLMKRGEFDYGYNAQAA